MLCMTFKNFEYSYLYIFRFEYEARKGILKGGENATRTF